jgi:hypothetical protein
MTIFAVSLLCVLIILACISSNQVLPTCDCLKVSGDCNKLDFGIDDQDQGPAESGPCVIHRKIYERILILDLPKNGHSQLWFYSLSKSSRSQSSSLCSKIVFLFYLQTCLDNVTVARNDVLQFSSSFRIHFLAPFVNK